MSKAKIKEWKNKLKSKDTPRGGESPRDGALPRPPNDTADARPQAATRGEGGGDDHQDTASPRSPQEAGGGGVEGAEAAQQGAAVPASPRMPSRSPRSGLRKKSYSTMDVHYQQHQQNATTPRSSASDTLRSGDESPAAGRKKRRSAKADTPVTAVGDAAADTTAAAPGMESGDAAVEEGEKKTWRRWSALMANVPLPLSTVLTKSNSFLLASPHSATSSASSGDPQSARGASGGDSIHSVISSDVSTSSPLASSSSSGTATLRRRGTTVMVVRSTEEENKVLREHIEQLQILLQEKHNEVQHFKTQLQAAKHEIAILKGQLSSGVRPVTREWAEFRPTGQGTGEQPRTRSQSMGEGSLVEIGSHLYDHSLEGADTEARGESPQTGSLITSPELRDRREDEEEEESKADGTPRGSEPEGDTHPRQDVDKRKERKKNMLMAMSRVDHSRFGMEIGGRSSLRAKSKERGDVLNMFARREDDEENQRSAHNNAKRTTEPLLSSSTHSLSTGNLPLLAPADSGFVVEDEHECEITTTFFAAEGTNWYHEHFYGQPHRNFLGIETPLGTVLVACRREGKTGDDRSAQAPADIGSLQPGTHATAFYRVLLFTQDGDQKMSLPATSIDVAGGRDPMEKLLGTVNPLLSSAGIVKEILHPDMPAAVRRLEAKERPRKYKFGLMLVKEDQTQEEDIFSNTGGSVDWYEFLNFIGDKVRLKGWNRFAGGLDVKMDTTGEFSRFTEWQGSEIMWHVATMLPLGEGSQQIARKRHIGNDICILVFLDGKDVTYSANTIRSHFIHNVITIRRIPSDSLEDDASQTRYHVSVASKEDVPLFGPPLPRPAIFQKDDKLKDFLLAKMINAELAAYRTTYFSKRLRLGRRALLDELVSDFFPLGDEHERH